MPSSACQTCALDRKSTRLNSSHTIISYAVFYLKKKTKPEIDDAHEGRYMWHSWMTTRPSLLTALPCTTLTSPTPCCRCFSSPLSAFFFNKTATTEIYTLSLHDALPI